MLVIIEVIFVRNRRNITSTIIADKSKEWTTLSRVNEEVKLNTARSKLSL